ncbi:MAG: DUF4396 domain-containing protein [Gemmatimonadales bacterium]|nr:DUF4396 domain-containing protein [Gemmatimonadales bacterium]
MREMAGGSYLRSLRQTLLPEFLSMNLLMAGMVVSRRAVKAQVAGGADPRAPGFWFVMSMALIVGFILAYGSTWWLVAKGLKHGMITVRVAGQPSSQSRRRAIAPAVGRQHQQAPGQGGCLVQGESRHGDPLDHLPGRGHRARGLDRASRRRHAAHQVTLPSPPGRPRQRLACGS